MSDTPSTTTPVPSFVDALVRTYAQKALTAAAVGLGVTGAQQGQIVALGVGAALGLVSMVWAFVAAKVANAKLIAAVEAPASIAVTTPLLK